MRSGASAGPGPGWPPRVAAALDLAARGRCMARAPAVLAVSVRLSVAGYQFGGPLLPAPQIAVPDPGGMAAQYPWG
jgi:hypothetical protein